MRGEAWALTTVRSSANPPFACTSSLSRRECSCSLVAVRKLLVSWVGEADVRSLAEDDRVGAGRVLARPWKLAPDIAEHMSGLERPL